MPTLPLLIVVCLQNLYYSLFWRETCMWPSWPFWICCYVSLYTTMLLVFFLLFVVKPFPCAVPINPWTAITVVVEVWCPPHIVFQGPLSFGPVLPCQIVSRRVLYVIEWADVLVEASLHPWFILFCLRLWRNRHLRLPFIGGETVLLIVFKIWCIHDDARRFDIHVDSRRSRPWWCSGHG